MSCGAFLITTVSGSQTRCIRGSRHLGVHEANVALHNVRWEPGKAQCKAPRGTGTDSMVCLREAGHSHECMTYDWDDTLRGYRQYAWLRIPPISAYCTAVLVHYTGGKASYCRLQLGHEGSHRRDHLGEVIYWDQQCSAVDTDYAPTGAGQPRCQGDSHHEGPHWTWKAAPGGGNLRYVWGALDRNEIKLDPNDPRSYIEQLKERMTEQVEARMQELIGLDPAGPIAVEIRVPVEMPLTTITVELPQDAPEQKSVRQVLRELERDLDTHVRHLIDDKAPLPVIEDRIRTMLYESPDMQVMSLGRGIDGMLHLEVSILAQMPPEHIVINIDQPVARTRAQRKNRRAH